MSGKTGEVSPHRRDSYKGQSRYQKKVAVFAEKMAGIGEFLTPEKQKERRKARRADYDFERRKFIPGRQL